MNPWWMKYKVDLPEGRVGEWKVEQFEVSEKDAKWTRTRSIFSSGGAREYVEAGTYTRLAHLNGHAYGGSGLKGVTVMSDTPSEISDHRWMFMECKDRGGRVLINGLGLGMATAAILGENPEIEMRVVELNADVIALVGPTLQERFGDRLEIVQANAFEYTPPKGERYTVVWHDIWNDICGDNVPEITRLKRKYGRRCDWQAAWCEYEMRRNR